MVTQERLTSLGARIAVKLHEQGFRISPDEINAVLLEVQADNEVRFERIESQLNALGRQIGLTGITI